MGFFYWGEENNPRRARDAERPGGHYETVDPRRLIPRHRVDRDERDRAAVERYEREPDSEYDRWSGEVWATRGLLGGLHLQNGHHRRQAAINRGRRIRVWIPD